MIGAAIGTAASRLASGLMKARSDKKKRKFEAGQDVVQSEFAAGEQRSKAIGSIIENLRSSLKKR